MANPIEIRGQKELERKLSSGRFQKEVKTGLGKAALHIKGKVATYPPVRRQPQPFKTLKSQRWFFAALASGEITVPYQRSGSLGQGWTIAQLQWHTAKIGNAVDYAPRVQGDDNQQSLYHRGNWNQADQVLEDEHGKATDILNQQLIHWIET